MTSQIEQMSSTELGEQVSKRVQTTPRSLITLEMLRSVKSTAYRFSGRFLNLEALESGLLHSRLIEYPYVLSKLATMPVGKVLDVGCSDGGNVVVPTLANLGWDVYGIDVRMWRYTHKNFHFLQGDISVGINFKDDFLDCAYAISSIEHFGLTGRYGIREADPEADIRTTKVMRRIVRPGGHFLLTIPYGEGGIVGPAARVYDRKRLDRLLSGWQIQDEHYWYLDNAGIWHEVPEELAARTQTPGGSCVALLNLVSDKRR